MGTSTGSTESFDVSLELAEAYEAKFVPALFGEWATALVAAAAPAPGDRVLDVACGTGIVARTAADRVGPAGAVVGVDLNEAMLTVARRIRPALQWRQADAAALPFPDASFDRVLCQAALMFFPDRVAALREMARVVTDEGVVAVQVPGRLSASEGYVAFHDVVSQHAGPDAISLLSSYFVLGDLDGLCALMEAAGLRVAARLSRLGHVRVESIDQFVATEIHSTPLVERITDQAYQRIMDGCRAALARFGTGDGGAALPIEAHIVTARPSTGTRAEAR